MAHRFLGDLLPIGVGGHLGHRLRTVAVLGDGSLGLGPVVVVDQVGLGGRRVQLFKGRLYLNDGGHHGDRGGGQGDRGAAGVTHGRARLGGAGPAGTGSHLKTTNQRTVSNQPITNREHSSQSGFVKCASLTSGQLLRARLRLSQSVVQLFATR